jgi:hypothetical protein
MAAKEQHSVEGGDGDDAAPGLHIDDFIAACHKLRVKPEKVARRLLELGIIDAGITDGFLPLTDKTFQHKTPSPESKPIYDEDDEISPGQGYAAQRGVIASTLIYWHNYKPFEVKGENKELRREPLPLRWAAKQLGLKKSTVADFFRREFGGHNRYRAICKNSPSSLINTLRKLNDELVTEEFMVPLEGDVEDIHDDTGVVRGQKRRRPNTALSADAHDED